jgi:isoleucyl-tRNA synthetase
VLSKLEVLRAEKAIGKSLEAVVTLQVLESPADSVLRKYAAALPELFNVSEVDFVTVTHNDPDYLPRISVRSSERPKCERCWRYVPDVAGDSRYPTVCLRCAEALEAIGFSPYTAPSPEPGV